MLHLALEQTDSLLTAPATAQPPLHELPCPCYCSACEPSANKTLLAHTPCTHEDLTGASGNGLCTTACLALPLLLSELHHSDRCQGKLMAQGPPTWNLAYAVHNGTLIQPAAARAKHPVHMEHQAQKSCAPEGSAVPLAVARAPLRALPCPCCCHSCAPAASASARVTS